MTSSAMDALKIAKRHEQEAVDRFNALHDRVSRLVVAMQKIGVGDTGLAGAWCLVLHTLEEML